MSDKSNTSEGEEENTSLETSLDTSGLSQEHPFKRTYPCRFGCGFEGDPRALAQHYKTFHKGEYRVNEGIEGPPPPFPEYEEAKELRATRMREEEARRLYADRRKKLEEMIRYKRLYEELASELGLNLPPSQSIATQQHYDPLYQDPLLRIKVMEYLDTLKEREEAKFRPVQTQPNNAIEAHYQQQIEALRQEIQNLQQTHSKEVSALKEELRKKEMETLQNEIKRLESEIKRIESFKPVGDYKLDEFRLIADSLKTISEKAPLKELLAKLPEISAALSGIIPQQQAPQQTRQGLIQILKERGLVVPS